MKIKCKWNDRKTSLIMGMRTQPSFETGHSQLEEGSEGEFIDTSKEGGCDEEDAAVPVEVTLEKKLTDIKGTLGDISQHRKHERENMGSQSKFRKQYDNLPKRRKDTHTRL